ncbi:hypothetical protein, partial [Paraburkholderia phenazinium]|uniref:hypothetical protein n=1 Tax=Paraburkholderia phenazinium TaxID=60549 RepID=UPI001C40B360
LASPSSAHTYRLLIFKDRLRIHHRNRTNFTYPAPLRSASLHQQQRNEIMKNFRYAVNRFFQLPEPAHFAESLATAGSPAPRAPFSGTRKNEILASRPAACKRYFERP